VLTPDALITLGSLNPNLVSLRLDYCGRINNKVFEAWSTSLSSLKRIELLGPFLVRTEAWQSFFAANPQLEGFLITQSPRFDIACMKALSKHCVNLHELRLKEVGKLDDAFVDAIQEMNPPAGWTLLDLSDPSKSLSEKALTQLFSAVGPSVKRLDLSGHHDFTDTVLTEGLQAHTSSLTHLRLSNILNITDEGVANFFTNYKNAPLREIDLSRNAELGVEPSLALDALLAHSGPSLRALNINGWREVPEPSLSNIGKLCPKLERLDVGWCREADDFVIKNVLDGCAALKEVKVWACNRLTVNCPRRRGVNMIGVEIAGAS
jgi:DNA repair protein RAD7